MKRKLKYLFLAVLLAFSTINTTPVKTVSATTEPNYVKLGGEPFGIKILSDGILVINVEEKMCGTDIKSPAYESGIKKNDIIKKINSENVYSSTALSDAIKENKTLVLNIERSGKELTLSVTPKIDNNGNPKLGMWVKDSSAGIGTVTYYDDKNGIFATLGHGICESETGALIPLHYGEINKATIYDVTKSVDGKAGTLNGYFEDEIIGTAYKNTSVGIFGKISEVSCNEYIEVGTRSEVTTGDALIYSTVDGNTKKAYDINIKRLNTISEHNGMLIEITDPELIEITGGITQGMSGSPIVQNGKLIGALTHVLINNVEYGYGIYIEDMIKEA